MQFMGKGLCSTRQNLKSGSPAGNRLPVAYFCGLSRRLERLFIMLLGLFLLQDLHAQLPAPDALTEGNAASWGVAAASYAIVASDDFVRFHDGSASVLITTNSGADTWSWTPATRDAGWDFSDVATVRFWLYAENVNSPGFQNNSPWIRIGTTETDYIEFHPTSEVLNQARDSWYEFRIPVNGDETWINTQVGSPDITEINFVEIHADTWEYGFRLWIDGLAFLSILDGPFEREELELFETWKHKPAMAVTTELGTEVPEPGEMTEWVSLSPSVATVDENGEITAVSAGETRIITFYQGIEFSLPLKVVAPVLPPVDEVVPQGLVQPAPDHIWDIPVLVIRYLPTTDGINLDTHVAPDFYDLGEITLADMKNRVEYFDHLQKFMLEEGSRFRGYKDPEARPSLGYRVVRYISVYEPLPPGGLAGTDANGRPVYYADYFGMFERLGIEETVNDLGVREIWLWNGNFGDSSFPAFDPQIHDPINARRVWESNMASPSTPDVSNSNQDATDLPVYDHTYVLYGQNIRRTQAEAVHNHGHQLERILPYAAVLQDGTDKLFNQDFVGFDPQYQMTLGRAGWTHMPPNTTVHYDVLNPQLVESDIEDWRPDHGGARTLVNVNTWGDLVYPWPGGAASVPQRIESQWYIYWMQNMPGLNNGIPYKLKDEMTNWWLLTARWDEVTKGYGLHTSVIYKDGFE
jgi:hypothetical protein